MHKTISRETINLKVGNIAKMSGLQLTVSDSGSDYRLVDVENDQKFGYGRRDYKTFLDYLDAITLGLVLAGQKENK